MDNSLYTPGGMDFMTFLHKVEGKDVWFKALANYDWMYFLKVISIDPDEEYCTCEYWDCDNPGENPEVGYDTMEVEIASIEISFPIELYNTEEMDEITADLYAEYEEELREDGIGDW